MKFFNTFTANIFFKTKKSFFMINKMLFTLTLLLSGLLMHGQSVEELLKTTGTAADYPGSDFVVVFEIGRAHV